MPRSKCARCGEIGHWARECQNPPDERGRQRMAGLNGLVVTSSSAETTLVGATEGLPQPSFVMYIARNPTGHMNSFVGAIFTIEASFIGLMVPPRFGILDTGAQHGVIGTPALELLCKELARHGLKVREIAPESDGANGIGGGAQLLRAVQVPIGLGGVSGLLTLNVVEQDAPLLMPGYLNRKLGMVLNCPEDRVDWKNINTSSKIVWLPSDHMICDIMEYPKSGWKNPHDDPKFLRHESLHKTRVPKSAFQIALVDDQSSHPIFADQIAQSDVRTARISDRERLHPEHLILTSFMWLVMFLTT